MKHNSNYYIKEICEKCPKYKTEDCTYDYGDSLTKIPCRALLELQKLNIDINET